MNCPNCGAPLHLNPGRDGLQCEYCKGIFFPDKNEDGVCVLDQAPDRICPACAVPLMNATLAGKSIHYCARCRGMLIPMAPFADLIEALRIEQPGVQIPPRPDPKELNRKLDCPLCHRHMETHLYYGGGNVVIDSCDPCCVNWLDQGELMRIVHAPHRSVAELE